MLVHFFVRFSTQHGQSILLCGNTGEIGLDNWQNAYELKYFNDEFWQASVQFADVQQPLQYSYAIKNSDGSLNQEWETRSINLSEALGKHITIVDTWNDTSNVENNFYTQAFSKIWLNHNTPNIITQPSPTATHIFRVKYALLQPGEVVCLSGDGDKLGNWNTNNLIILTKKGDWYSTSIDLSNHIGSITYKYGIYNLQTKSFVQFEEGNNRVYFAYNQGLQYTVFNDGFLRLPNRVWRGAGLALPVFSLRTEHSFGIGEFTDMVAMAMWAKQIGLKILQILPINDTTSNYTFTDSYPYSAITAFALHPIYINVDVLAGEKYRYLVMQYQEKRQELNSKPAVDYVETMKVKKEIIAKLYPLLKHETFSSENYQLWAKLNSHWLYPYAAFCYLRDKNQSADFNTWPKYSQYQQQEIDKLVLHPHQDYEEVALHLFIQYHLHVQLLESIATIHQLGLAVKGDIPIGINRNSADAWQQPELYNMNMQAGAPPDDFAVAGQNWGFPTYNWDAMAANNFLWWQQRFEHMGQYFDAFRIDHILGFFRIWSIPLHAVQGIMGYFVPALPVALSEFHERGIWFDYNRYTQPFINNDTLNQYFGALKNKAEQFFENHFNGSFSLKPEFNTQVKVEKYFDGLPSVEENDLLKDGLYNCISNFILIEVEGSNRSQFHFRISMTSTQSFKALGDDVKGKLEDLYVNYFFRRQDDFWGQQAMKKLPALKRCTNMLVCGEDLGMVPDCVPGIMKSLGLLSLEIQRMPKDPTRKYFHPADAPYLSVVTPSTHDMSTVRGWWEENAENTQQFFEKELGQQGPAPTYCESWVNNQILVQHLYSPAMLSIFQWQDIMGMNAKLRRENPNDERINVPANPKHYWQYRMHIPIEQLMEEATLNNELKNLIIASGRFNSIS
jgi:4-alpha-glucanotransferase